MLRLTLSTIALLLIAGCGGDDTSTQANTNNDYSNTNVYYESGPYAGVLKGCVLIEDRANECTLSKLPILGQENTTITKEMILQRLLVSHAWMGDRFSQMLDRYSDKMIQQLFGSTTAIVIDDDIIPAYYWAVTGAIYLDPRYLWLTEDEKATIVEKDDFRSDYGSELAFYEATFFRKNNQSLYTQDKLNRTHAEIELPLAGLLYHELAHANDFIPPAFISSLNNDLSVLDNINSIGASRTSEQLYVTAPIESEILSGLGQVLYKGNAASQEQKQMNGMETGALFNYDVAASMYAYSTKYEDMAMLFQTAMMKYFYNVDGYQIFFNAKEYEDNGKVQVEWGIKNPVLKSRVKSRAIFVSNRLLPISGGWTSRIEGIYDGASLLATSSNREAKQVHRLDDIHSNEFQGLHTFGSSIK